MVGSVRTADEEGSTESFTRQAKRTMKPPQQRAQRKSGTFARRELEHGVDCKKAKDANDRGKRT